MQYKFLEHISNHMAKTNNVKNPNWQKAFQEFLQADQWISAIAGDRIAYLRVKKWENPDYRELIPCVVMNEGSWDMIDYGNQGFEKGIDVFPILIDVVVNYDDFHNGMKLRNLIRKKIWAFEWAMGTDREWSIRFQQFLSHDYNPQTDTIILGGIYMVKQNYDYSGDT